MKKLQIELANFPQSTILDIGTGYGSFIEILTKNFNDYREIIGIDTSQTAIDAAKNHFKDYERIKFIKSDAFTMHFENETFDIITLSNSLHHLHNLPTLFDQMRRVLKKDGIVIVNEMLSDPLTLPQISHRLIHHFAAEIDREKGIIHDETFTESDILNLLNKTCFKIKDHWPINNESEDLSVSFDTSWVHGTLDQMLKRIQNSAQIEYYTNQANLIKNHVSQHGFSSATQMLFILQPK